VVDVVVLGVDVAPVAPVAPGPPAGPCSPDVSTGEGEDTPVEPPPPGPVKLGSDELALGIGTAETVAAIPVTVEELAAGGTMGLRPTGGGGNGLPSGPNCIGVGEPPAPSGLGGTVGPGPVTVPGAGGFRK